MNIVYGISGFGNGHVARSASVLKALLARGHRIAVMGFDNSERYITANYPAIPLLRIKVPVLHPSPTGLDFGKIANDPANLYDDGIAHNYRAMQDALDYFGGPPNVVLSDYELVAAQFAYATLRPLISIDQHSKYPGFQFPNVNGYSRLEDYARLNLFFPYADARFAASFFKVDYPPDPKFKVTLIPPILRQDVLNLSPRVNEGEILVYVSPFARLPQSLDDIYGTFEAFSDYIFHIFLPNRHDNRANLQFYQYQLATFLDVMARCQAVISTAGHNLLSELVYLKKPVYVMPSATFDQQICAQVIDSNGLGQREDSLTPTTLRRFFDRLPEFRHNLHANRGIVDGFDGVGVLMSHLAAQFGL